MVPTSPQARQINALGLVALGASTHKQLDQWADNRPDVLPTLARSPKVMLALSETNHEAADAKRRLVDRVRRGTWNNIASDNYLSHRANSRVANGLGAGLARMGSKKLPSLEERCSTVTWGKLLPKASAVSVDYLDSLTRGQSNVDHLLPLLGPRGQAKPIDILWVEQKY